MAGREARRMVRPEVASEAASMSERATVVNSLSESVPAAPLPCSHAVADQVTSLADQVAQPGPGGKKPGVLARIESFNCRVGEARTIELRETEAALEIVAL